MHRGLQVFPDVKSPNNQHYKLHSTDDKEYSGRSVRSLLLNEILPIGNSTKSFNINDLKPGLYIYRVLSESINKNGIITKN